MLLRYAGEGPLRIPEDESLPIETYVSGPGVVAVADVPPTDDGEESKPSAKAIALLARDDFEEELDDSELQPPPAAEE